MSFDFKDISKQLNEATTKDESGVSFSGKTLKLDSKKDAEEVCKAIKECSRLDFLDLEGNTLGTEAAEAISETLASHGSQLKRALWKDMFTGRMKTEIPKALEFLGNGLSAAGARLVELDLSDNAFGPIGVQGLAALLSSKTCYTLKELRLNNNGLGISGGKMLAKALLDCHANSLKEEAKPLALRVFIAGRNRLENDGAKALAAVFKTLGSLEEVVMPQNGIYHPGVEALANALSVNPGLKVLNLNDNTVGPKGAQALANVFANFSSLETLNLGDCLLKTKGAVVIADALGVQGNHTSLVELNLSFNEIKTDAINSLAKAMIDKTQLTSLQLDGNAFGSAGCIALRKSLTNYDRIEPLGTLDEDASDNDEDENDDEEQEDGEDEEEDEDVDDEQEHGNDVEKVESNEKAPGNFPKINNKISEKVEKVIDVKDFISSPTGENLLLLKGNKASQLLDYVENLSIKDKTQDKSNLLKNPKYISDLLHVIMKVSSLCGSGYMDVRIEAEKLTDILYSDLFTRAAKDDLVMSCINNMLLVNLGLLKGEDKSANKLDWNLEGCFKALEKIVQRDYFPSSTKEILKVFIGRTGKPSRAKFIDPLLEVKTSLKNAMDRLNT